LSPIGDIGIDQWYWPKIVRLNERFVYLVGGHNDANGFLENTSYMPQHSINLLGLGPNKSYVLQSYSMGEDYRMHSACALHKKSKTLYILGGYRKGKWVPDANKFV